MKRAITLILVALLILPAFSQELTKKEQRQLAKELKKEAQAEELAEKSLLVTAMISQATFVLEAYTLRNKQGESIQVTSALNFVAADSTTGMLQVGSDAGIGPNGVGGVTVKGQVKDYKFSQHEKSGSYNVSYYLQTPDGTFEVRLRAYPDGRADADISNATWGGRITFIGYLVHPSLSRVYEGMAL